MKNRREEFIPKPSDPSKFVRVDLEPLSSSRIFSGPVFETVHLKIDNQPAGTSAFLGFKKYKETINGESYYIRISRNYLTGTHNFKINKKSICYPQNNGWIAKFSFLLIYLIGAFSSPLGLVLSWVIVNILNASIYARRKWLLSLFTFIVISFGMVYFSLTWLYWFNERIQHLFTNSIHPTTLVLGQNEPLLSLDFFEDSSQSEGIVDNQFGRAKVQKFSFQDGKFQAAVLILQDVQWKPSALSNRFPRPYLFATEPRFRNGKMPKLTKLSLLQSNFNQYQTTAASFGLHEFTREDISIYQWPNSNGKFIQLIKITHYPRKLSDLFHKQAKDFHSASIHPNSNLTFSKLPKKKTQFTPFSN